MKVVIVGAGIGGLTAALALLRHGMDVEVCEQAAELREVGAGLQLSANASRVLYALGLEEALKAISCEAEGKEIRLWNTGETWKLFDLGKASVERYGFPYFTVYRPDLLAVLADAVRREKAGAIRLGVKCETVSQDAARATVNGTISADAVVGADGVHSRVRQALFGADRAEFSGIVFWRGIVPMSQLPGHLARRVGTNWIGPGAHIVHYPLRGGALMNFVGALERKGWEVESWSARGDPEEMRRDFAGWHADVQALLGALPQPNKWALMIRPPMARWTKGRVTLLGDACHPMVPFLAQGAAMAIEDGFVLARCLAREGGDAPAALQRYEAARRERTTRAVEGSAANTGRFHNQALADPVEGRRYVEREWAGRRISERYDWLFDYDATTAPI